MKLWKKELQYPGERGRGFELETTASLWVSSKQLDKGIL